MGGARGSAMSWKVLGDGAEGRPMGHARRLATDEGHSPPTYRAFYRNNRVVIVESSPPPGVARIEAGHSSLARRPAGSEWCERCAESVPDARRVYLEILSSSII